MTMADALVIVTAEYNQSFPGCLNMSWTAASRSTFTKPRASSAFQRRFGGVRAIQDLLPVIRELGLVNIFWDVNFGTVSKVFDASGELLDGAFGREHISLDS